MPSFRSARDRTLLRDGYRCRRCLRYRVPLTIHHIKPRREGGNNSSQNLVTLCLDCHGLWNSEEHTTHWSKFPDFLGADIFLTPQQLSLLQEWSPVREDWICIRWPLLLERLSDRLWRWRWIDKSIGILRKRKFEFVSYHFDFTVSRGPSIQSVRPYNDCSANGLHLVTVDSPWRLGCPLELPHAPLSADDFAGSHLVLRYGSRLCPSTRTGSAGFLPRAPVFSTVGVNVPADGLLAPEKIEELLLVLSMND